MADHFDPEAETVTDAWEGVFLSCSWGYNQTQRNYAQIVDVSDSGKTVLCRRVGADVVDRTKTSEHVTPNAEQVGPEFRLHVRGFSDDRPSFKGSYPFIWAEVADGEPNPSTRMGLFTPCDRDARPDYQTAPNAGH